MEKKKPEEKEWQIYGFTETPDNYGDYDYYGDSYYNRIYNKMLDCDWFSAHLFDT